jgi:AcrR family transcriptional regulator
MPERTPLGSRGGGQVSGTGLCRKILDTTRLLLVEEGYNNLSMRKIARAVGCSATSIYLHFESKDALIHALIDEGMEQLRGRLQVARDAGARPLAGLESLCREYIRYGLENPEYYEVMFAIHPEHMARYPAEKYRRARRNLDLFAAALRDTDEAGALRVPDPDFGACVVWAALHGAVTLLIAKRLDVRIDPEAFVEGVVHQALSGFRTYALQPQPL